MTAQIKPAELFKKASELLADGKYQESVDLFRVLLPLAPREPGLLANMGVALRKLDKHEAALAFTRRALELQPENTSFMTNAGNCLVALDRKDEALAYHETAARLSPDDFNIRLNYAFALREFLLLDEALEQINLACSLQPDHNEAAWERGIILRSMGRFEEGWPDFEARWKRNHKKEPVYGAPKWEGQDLAGKTILVSEEQGYGDTILCARYIPLLKAKGARVLLGCRTALHRLFKEVPGVDRIVEAGPLGERFDYHIPIMSLPRIFNTGLSNVPPMPALSVSVPLPAKAAELLKMGEGRFRVGIVWSGNPAFQENRKRAVSIDRFIPLAQIKNVQLFSLQKGAGEEQLAQSGAQGLIPELGPLMSDFADTVAALRKLDLVVMTDSSVAHLAGSAGVPVWNLLHYRPYWLYGMTGDKTPWYPGMRLIRQPSPGDWDSVFARVATDLEKLACPK
ncbi:MAG: tetratricopeptide repeat-containing glycosyltransferase family protein [bacterium]|nr:tetratricopeptide repeat-containing glycosyltransferase family protein [bacterium]